MNGIAGVLGIGNEYDAAYYEVWFCAINGDGGWRRYEDLESPFPRETPSIEELPQRFRDPPSKERIKKIHNHQGFSGYARCIPFDENNTQLGTVWKARIYPTLSADPYE